MGITKFEQSLADGEHSKLMALQGSWKGITKTWFEKDVLVDEAPMQATITAILGNRFISCDYSGSLEGKPFEGKMIIGYDIPYQQYTFTWMDSFHMGTQIMQAKGDATANGFSIMGSYGNPEWGDQLFGWRTELKIVSGNEFVLTAYNVMPGEEEAKATETVYKRA
ncbi:DUF1579 domain-containing protein [Pedobacter sandarakinus]|uniref:DUF1579 domain-containing protein n=1 Tax=Pedobacter sandarakinus TaxID=353156 RepID=UPI0022478D21|nr:DUF1579 domain-containing protein [Pedobacter sandarakinus]MCX2575052.1 DUF1579 domain-containing protein [Pedobacter sandarakinus]